MSEKIGMVNVSQHEEHMFLGRDLFKGREVSEQTARDVDEEIRRIIEAAYGRAKEILIQYHDKLIALAEALIEYETLDAPELTEVISTGKLINPPKRKTGLGTPPTATPTPPTEPADQPEIDPGPVIDPSPASA